VKKWIVIGALFIAGAALSLWLMGEQQAQAPVASLPTSASKVEATTARARLEQRRRLERQAVLARSKKVVRRCPKGGRRKGHPLRLMLGEQLIWEKPAREVMKMPGTIILTKGRHKGEPGLPLAALSTQSTKQRGDGSPFIVEVVPCTGPAKRYMRGEFIGNKPDGLNLVITPRGMMKLMDMRQADGHVAVKNIYSIRFRNMSGRGGGQRHKPPFGHH